MSITADPLFVTAEVAYRRESLAAGLPVVRRARRHHGLLAGLVQQADRLHHRHGAARRSSARHA